MRRDLPPHELLSSLFCDCAFLLAKPKQLPCSPPPAKQRGSLQLFCANDVSPGTEMPLATRRLKTMQLSQPGRLSLRLFCAYDVFFPVKAIRWARVIER